MSFLKRIVVIGLFLTALASPTLAADLLIVKAGGGSNIPILGIDANNVALSSYSAKADLIGNIYITNDEYFQNNLPGKGFLRVNPWGKIDRIFTDLTLSSYWLDDISIDGAGNVFLVSYSSEIFKISPNGEMVSCASVPESTESVSLDAQGNIFIGTHGSSGKIYKANGKTCDGTLSELYSQSSGVDSLYADDLGNVYFSTDWPEYRIKKINPQGNVANFAGNGMQNHTGDGGPATSAQISMVRGIVGDEWGNIYFSEKYNGTSYIRKIDSQGTISTIQEQQVTTCGDYEHIRLSIDKDGMVYMNEYASTCNPGKVVVLKFNPILSSLSVTGGSVGDNVILSGRYFGSIGTGGIVSFNGVAAQILHWSNQTIICTVPQGATTGNVVVTTPEGQPSAGINFKVR